MKTLLTGFSEPLPDSELEELLGIVVVVVVVVVVVTASI
tara:strand:+ start:299 stop:415 length:117 start_codon:yes stop_codon:yes gene_type:complete